MGGLGIAQFLKHSNDSGGSGQWLRNWRKNQVGEVTFWLHTRAPIVPSFTHQFMLEDTFEDKETGKKVPILRFPRFVSPDPEQVHKNQYFREDNDVLRVLPDLDPFLLLREWLRFADHLALDQPIFKWHNPKERKTIVWERGELSGKVKRGQSNFGHSLDTRIDYIYVVVDNDNAEGGPVLAREGKLLSQKIADVIKQQQKQFGDDQGDPMQHPYAFTCVAEKASTPMKAFNCFKAERAEFTDAVWAAIAGDEYPDPTAHGRPQDGDLQKIRDAFEAAAQVELPLDEIFSDDSLVRRELCRGVKGRQTGPAPRQSKAAQARGQVARPPLPKPGAAGAAPADEPDEPDEPAPAVQPQTRRKKSPPPVETIPCDDCGTPMPATAAKCEKCGTEYEPMPDEAPAPAQKPAASKPAAAPKPGVAAKPTAASKPKPQTAAAKPKEADTPADEEPDGKCWACGVDLDENNPSVCPKCGIDQADNIPF